MDKEHILREIRRTAEANGGKPLGSRRMETETGIKVSDWRGIHWTVWSEAQLEAGYTPNQKSRRHDKTDLLHSLAGLALERSHFPRYVDLKLKARHDPGFPSPMAFRRLGRKSHLIAQLADYCRGRAGYEDVVRLCEEQVPREGDAPVDPGKARTEDGEIYLMKSGRFHKIGRSSAAGRRQYELGIQLPEEIKTVHVIRTDDPSGIEAYWHKRFEAKRKKGEWFELDAADIRAFKRRKFM